MKLLSMLRNRTLFVYSSIVVISAVVAIGLQYLALPTKSDSRSGIGFIALPNNLEMRANVSTNLIEGETGFGTIEIKSRTAQGDRLNYQLKITIKTSDTESYVSRDVFHLSQLDNSDTFRFSSASSGLHTLYFQIATYTASDFNTVPDILEIQVLVLPTWQHRISVSLRFFIPFLVLSLLGWQYIIRKRAHEQRIEQKVEQAANKAEAEPEKPKYAWDAARINLEAYFERNRFQVAQVFAIAIIVMSIGFILVCFGVYLAMIRPDTIKPALVAGVSGIITQFIGATFMVIYRSTMTQANEFMVILERINTVGMAIQVLELIPESEAALKNASRAKIVELLLSANVSTKRKRAKRAT